MRGQEWRWAPERESGKAFDLGREWKWERESGKAFE